MLYKVIKYIEFTQNTQILKISVFAIKDLKPQKTITQSQFAQFFHRYGIFFMVSGESSCPDGSEFVWERGVGGL